MSDMEKRSSTNDVVAASTHDIEEQGLSDDAKRALHGGPPPFRWASLWEPAQINPLNGKSYTLPMLRLNDQYAINFHRESLLFPLVPFFKASVNDAV